MSEITENLPIPPAINEVSVPPPSVNSFTSLEEPEIATAKLPLGERLVVKGMISRDQLEVALKEQKEQKSTRKMLGAVLVQLGFITESALGEVLTESTGITNFSLESGTLDPNLIKKVPKDVALRYKAIPISLKDPTLYVALTDIYNIVAMDQIRLHFPKNFKIVPVYISETQILEIIDQYYDYEMSVDGILKEIESGISADKKLSGEQEGYVNPTVRLVDSILIDAIKCGASDIHYEPDGSFLRLRYRIDGELIQIRTFHKDYWAPIVVRIKILSNMNIAETRHPQDGRISYNVLGRDIDFRVATQPTIHGENIVMRILDKRKALVPMEKLGFSEHNTDLLKKLLKRPEGIIIVTGPTGSGKTTTLYSILNFINSINVNIMTLEDPVEYQLPMIRQANIREGSGMDFLTGIKSLMRQDPDIIFVGEVRDKDTATMAVRAAMTGHQVFTTLHTNDAIGAIPRLIDIGIPSTLLSGSLICVMAQRLARKLCSHCRNPVVASPEACKILGVDPSSPPTIYYKKGCDLCKNSGYRGRTALNEIIAVDREMDELIAKASTRKVMLDYAKEQGFVPMVMDGIQKVLTGIIDLDELIANIDVTDRM